MILRLQHASDWRAIAFVVITYALLLLPLFWQIPVLFALIWVPLSGLFCFCVGIIAHNHMHTPIFQHQWHNQLFNVVLTPAMGHTATQIVIPHNYNHHAYHGGTQDWSRPELAGAGMGIVRLIRYWRRTLKNASGGKHREDVPPLPNHLKQSLPVEKRALLGFVVIVLAIAPLKALVFVGLPWILGILCMLGINLIQHDGCDAQSRFNHSRNFTGRLSNWFFFNNGYHTIHHLKPTLHWSLLPEAHHRLVKPDIASELDVKSILSFLLSQYLFSDHSAATPAKIEKKSQLQILSLSLGSK
ncbi:MAG: fatty acid desaturase [Cyanobacteriota bacterium]